MLLILVKISTYLKKKKKIIIIISNIYARNLPGIYPEYCCFGYYPACGLFEANPEFTLHFPVK